MKNGYQGELESFQNTLLAAKAPLEELYACRHEDKALHEDQELKEKMDQLMTQADSAILSFTAGSKPVKNALVSRLHIVLTC